jgi:hypothetical protein
VSAFSTVDDALGAGPFVASECSSVRIDTEHDLARMCAEILSTRSQPVIGVTLRPYEQEPVLAANEIAAVVGPGVRIFVVTRDELLLELRRTLGPRLRLDRGTLRIWWPGAHPRCDPAEHPVVVALEDEDVSATLEELGYQFDLSRPRVRGRIEMIEDARAFLDHELARAQGQNRRLHERLRDTQIECHTLRMRAEAAEARLDAPERPGERD